MLVHVEISHLRSHSLNIASLITIQTRCALIATNTTKRRNSYQYRIPYRITLKSSFHLTVLAHEQLLRNNIIHCVFQQTQVNLAFLQNFGFLKIIPRWSSCHLALTMLSVASASDVPNSTFSEDIPLSEAQLLFTYICTSENLYHRHSLMLG